MIKISSKIYTAPDAIVMAAAEEQSLCAASPQAGQIEQIEYEDWTI